MADRVPDTPRVYRLGPGRRLALLGAWALLCLPPLIAGLALGDWSAVAAGALAGLILGLLFLVAGGLYPALVLTQRGITLRQVGYTLEAEWRDVAGLRREPGREGLLLRRPMSCAGAGRLAALAGRLSGAPAALRPYPPEVLEQIRARCYIPMEAFGHWLRRGDLERRLLLHAPWLADGGPPSAGGMP